MARWTRLLRTIHIYAGLQALVGMVLFGLAGLGATWRHSPGFELPRAREVRIPLEGAEERSKRELADAAYQALDLPLAGPPADWAIKDREQGRLFFRLETPNHHADVSIDPAAGEAVARVRPLAFAERAVLLHRLTFNRLPTRDKRLLAWALYIEFSLWALWVFILSGLYLGAMGRPGGKKLALWSFASGCAALAVVLWVVR